MLPSNLLITRRWRERITPVYAELSQENLEIARLLIQVYRNHLGERKDELNEAACGLEELGYDYRYVRGLATLLDRRCALELKTTEDPVRVRRTTFKIAHEKGVPVNQEERQAILREAAEEIGLTTEELEDSLYGDLEGELLLKAFEPPDPENLVKQYNLSLTQTLLFYSTELSFTTLSNWQQIFRQIKWLGLIYTISRRNGGYEVKVDGPISLFKLNRRYGTSLARILPAVMKSREWSLHAKILSRKAGRRILNLELNSDKHGRYMEAFEETEEVYDSLVERDFADRFRTLSTGWTLTREPEPIPVGRQVMIPDFSFQKGKMKVFMEVAGFWTPQYLDQKVKKLSLLDDMDMIVAADRNLACQKLERIGKRLNLIYYRRRIPLRPILTYLKTKEERLVEDQTKRLRNRRFEIQKPVVELGELAETLNVQEEALRKVLEERDIPGYTNVGDLLIDSSRLGEIHKLLEKRLGRGELALNEASKIIQNAGVKNSIDVLATLGYVVMWQGLDPKLARVKRRNGT